MLVWYFYSFASCVGVYHSITCPTTPYLCSNHQLEIRGFHRVDIFSGWKPLEFRALNVRIDLTIVIWANNYISMNVFLNSSKQMNGLWSIWKLIPSNFLWLISTMCLVRYVPQVYGPCVNHKPFWPKLTTLVYIFSSYLKVRKKAL